MSYALNDKPGVSEHTRRKVQEIAAELGWAPSLAAKSLSTSRSNSVGLVLRRPARMLGNEPFYMEFVAGVESVIAPHDVALMLHIATDHEREIQIYKKWWSQRRVDGVLLVDMAMNDPRIDAVGALGLPAVAIASTTGSGGLPHLWTDDAGATVAATKYLIKLGHKRIARVGGIPTLDHSVVRNASFVATMLESGLPHPTTIDTDFSGEAGSRATRELVTGPNPPTAIIYDNDIMAIAGLSVASEMGIDVPRELSLLAWDDSPLCRLTHPAVSAMGRDISALGSDAATMLMTLMSTGSVDDRESERPVIIPRGSTSMPIGP